MVYLAIVGVLVIAYSVTCCVMNGIGDYESREVKKIGALVLVGAIVVLTIPNSFFIVGEQENAYVTAFGKPSYVEGKGFKVKLPWSAVHKKDATMKGMSIGYDPNTDQYLEEDSLMITSDFNFLNSDYYIEYYISDPIEYDYGTSDPELFLKCIAQSSIRNTVGLFTIDNALTTGRNEIETRIRDDIIRKLGNFHTGITVHNVSTQDTEPPTAIVSAAFQRVVDAQSNAEKMLNEANAYENEVIPKAKASAKKAMDEAEAIKTERVNQAKQEVAEFTALYNEYKKNPDTVKQKLYYDAISDILPNMNVIIGNNDVKVINMTGMEDYSTANN